MRDLIKRNYLEITSFLWGISEATFFFILPDAFILPATVLSPKKHARIVFASWLGSIVGVCILYLLFSTHYYLYKEFVFSLPFTHEAMMNKVGNLLNKDSLMILFQPVSGVPAKVWMIKFFSRQVDFLTFAIPLFTGRLIRMILVGLLGRKLSPYFIKFKQHKVKIIFIYIIMIVSAVWLSAKM